MTQIQIALHTSAAGRPGDSLLSVNDSSAFIHLLTTTEVSCSDLNKNSLSFPGLNVKSFAISNCYI